MNVLLIGSGGREHALAWKISESPSLEKLYCLPGNGGTAEIAQNVQGISPLEFEKIEQFCKHNKISLVVVGPEDPLVAGIADYLESVGIAVFGPSKYCAQMEGSKAFTKAICDKANIPTAAYQEFTDAASAEKYIREVGAPIVVKADGLAAGKGVVVAGTVDEAISAAHDILGGKFGASGAKIVVEEFLEGEELSFFVISDGKEAVYLGSAKDHKRAFDGDKGPNTGGMGTFSPAASATPQLVKQVMETIIQPTLNTLVADGHHYKGVLFAGLMLTKKGPQLLEYNCRFGDPETQVLMRRIDGDLLNLLNDAANGKISHTNISFNQSSAVCVVMATKGYPDAYKNGSEIRDIEAASKGSGVQIFHAGTVRDDNNRIIANGGRVLGVTAVADNISNARLKAYCAVDGIKWPEGFCRRDIGIDA